MLELVQTDGPRGCRICGREPDGAVVLARARGGHEAGQICASHTLAEVLQHPSGKFLVLVVVVE